MKRQSLALTSIITLICIYEISRNHENRQRSKSGYDVTAVFEDFSEDDGKLFLPETQEVLQGLVLRQPSSHGFPSFTIDDLEGTVLPYAKIECGTEVFKPGHKVPNLIHYVWFGNFRINLVQYYAIRSAALIQKPRLILFHMDDDEPVGYYWERLKSEIPCMRIVSTVAPDKVFDQKVRLIEHKSDVARINILLKYGGIYSDVNVIFVRPMDDLMGYSVVLGKEEDRSFGNSFILSERNASFIQIWLESYINFDHTHWSDHSTVMPLQLHKLFPQLPLHVEKYSMMRPNYMDGPEWLSHNNWDLRYNYCVHLYVNEPAAKEQLAPILKLSESDLVTLDNTFGQLIRISLFGTPYFRIDDLDRQLLEAHSPFECQPEKIKINDVVIPNILHYVWNGEKLQFQHYLALRAAIQTTSPHAVYFHALSDADPFYYGYLTMLREVTCLKIVDATHLANMTQTSSNNLLPRLQILYKYGGILLDFNTTLMRPLSDLMENDFVIGKNEDKFDDGLIMARPNSDTVLQLIKYLQEHIEHNNDHISRIIDSSIQNVLTIENFIFVPNKSWFDKINPEIPKSTAISLRHSGLDVLEYDRLEKYVLRQDNFIGILGRIVLFSE